MNRLESRVHKLEKILLPSDNETIIIIVKFVSPPGKEQMAEGINRFHYPPIEEQIAAQRPAGKNCIVVFEYAKESA